MLGKMAEKDNADYKQLEQSLNQYIADRTAQSGTSAPAAVAANGADQNAQNGQNNQGDQANNGQQQAKPVVESKFFGKINAGEGDKPIEFKDLTELQKHIGSALGLPSTDVESPDFMSNFLKNTQEWQKEAQQKSVLEQQLNQVQKEFEQLPAALFEGMQAWAKGENYQDVIKQHLSGLDLTKSFDNNEKATVLNHYFPGQYNAEQIGENGDAVKAALNLAKMQFARDQQAFEVQRKEASKTFDQQVQVLRDSAQSSVGQLKKEFPSFENTDVAQVQRLMETDDVLSLFKDKDGKYLPDAAKRLAFALNGELEVKNLSEALKKQTETASQIVNTGQENVQRNASQNGTATPGATEQEVLKSISGLVEKSPYSHVGAGTG
jgi:ribosomal protein L12E/L44/L45/RPP1/RPP2